MQQSLTWKQLVAQALEALGGEASLKDITAKLKNNPLRPQTPTWDATIRRVVRQYKIFEPIKTEKGLAGYRLIDLPELKPKLPGKENDPHGEQQGMLLQLGILCGYETFTNSTDKTLRKFRNEPLSKFATIKNDAGALEALPLGKMRTADVIWMAEDSAGLYPRYAFEVEHSTKVKDGLLRLLRIPERFHTDLFVIGSGNTEQKLFNRYLQDRPFRQHAGRLHFVRYADVAAFYESGVTFTTLRTSWGIEMAKS